MFKHYFRKLTAFMTIMILVIGCAGIFTTQVSAASTTTVGNEKYTIISNANMSVQYAGTAKASAASVSIPETINIGNKTYNVVSIAANALTNNTKIKKLTIGKNVTKIGKNAFYGCKNLKTVTIKTTGLTKSSVGSNAFKGLDANAIITVPLEKVALYRKLLKSRGVTNNKITIIAADNTSWENYKQGQPILDPKKSAFTIGDFSIQNPGYTDANKITDTAEYSIGDDIPFTAGMMMDERIYGDWKKEYISGKKNYLYYQCGFCRKNFETDTLLGLHCPLMDCSSANYYFYETLNPYYGWFFYPDHSPCRVIYKFTLSDGLSFKDESLKAKAMGSYNIPDKNYTVEVIDHQVIVTINDIKASPFYTPFNKEEYDKNPYAYKYDEAVGNEGLDIPINILFEATLNKNVEVVNTVSANVTYSYKGKSRTIDLGSRNIYAASMKISHTDTNGNPLPGGTFTLYAQEAVFAEGSSLGTYQWKEVKSGLKSGDVVSGLGKKYYKLVQDTFPDGYKKYITPEFSVGIKTDGGNITVTSTDNNSWTPLEVVNGIVQVIVKNSKSA